MITWYARNDVPYSGGEKQLSITFPYIKKEHIKVFVNDVETTEYHFLNESQIFLDCSLKKGDMMSVRRNTPIDEKMVNFTNTSILNAEKQNLAQTQLLNAVQEIYDNNIEFKDETTAQVASFEARVEEVEATTAESANIVAENAVLSASALSNSEQAVTTANSAHDTATEALLTSEQANSYATEARDSATIALDIATTSSNKVDVFEESIETVLEAADKITVLEGAVGEATEAAQAAVEAVEEVEGMISAIDNKASIDLENLSIEGQAKFDEKANVLDVLDKSQITNCILEVPQRIKYILEDGVFTLKAGSVVVVPNGAGVFEEVIISKDLSIGASALGSAKRFVAYNNGSLIAGSWSVFQSGTTPTSTAYYYHSSENKIYVDGIVTTNFSLPIMVGDYTKDYGFTSIDQVFNGFGYFGNHIWVDKGVKILVSNGFNEDGTINNFVMETPFLMSKNSALNGAISFIRHLGNSYQLYNIAQSAYLGELDYIPKITATFQWYFNTNEMKWYMHEANETKWKTAPYYHIAPVISATSTAITSFEPYKPFRGVNYSEYKADMDGKVSKSGDTMNGQLVINGSQDALHINANTWGSLILQNSNIDINTPPSANQFMGMDFRDNAGNRLGFFGVQQDTTGETLMTFQTQKSKGILAPTPAIGDNSNKIATTAYCVNMRCTTKPTTTSSASATRPAWIVQNYLNGTSWYRVWSDGWKEQGGQCTAVEGDARYLNITYLKAFSNTNYTLNLTGVSQGMANTDYAHIYSITASGARLVSAGGAKPIHWYACGY